MFMYVCVYMCIYIYEYPTHKTLTDSANSMWSHFPLKCYRILFYSFQWH